MLKGRNYVSIAMLRNINLIFCESLGEIILTGIFFKEAYELTSHICSVT